MIGLFIHGVMFSVSSLKAEYLGGVVERERLVILAFFINKHQKMVNMKSYQLGKRKNVWKKVRMPSISSSSMSASPKRKNDLWRFLSCGQRVFQAESNCYNTS